MVTENGIRQRKAAAENTFVPTDEGKKLDERLDKHERSVFRSF